MIQNPSAAAEQFRNSVGVNFQLYNSLFLSLPFYEIDKTGVLLSLFNQNCEDGFKNGKTVPEIIDEFFTDHTSISDENEKIDLLFRFVQYAERQIVLFDALEDAAFRELHDLSGAGTLKQLESAVLQQNRQEELKEKLENFAVRLVLTAHPTQFYPGSVLGIINDLVDAIKTRDVAAINILLQQLGRTPFLKKQKPTPFDEAVSLIWYLENIFYNAIGNIVSDLKNSFPNENFDLSGLIKMGFWSGGDRDGNPFVTVETTRRVADSLRRSILKCYYNDVRLLKRRLTFSGVESTLAELERRLYRNAFQLEEDVEITKGEIIDCLLEIRSIIIEKHNGLFVRLVDDLVEKVKLFGLFFATLDIRQDSSIHDLVLKSTAEKSDLLPENYPDLSEDEKIDLLLKIDKAVDSGIFEDDLVKDTIENLKAVKQIQAKNGEESCHRYIISHAETALSIIEVFGLFLLAGWTREELSFDIIPLFETVDDLQNAPQSMEKLYLNEDYAAHLRRRGNTQTIMLGFSDGTKDGGYLMANYGIYKAKDELTEVSRKHGIKVIFFDGRGGPPARGGGKTHKFYSSMGENISNAAIELTIQGQTVSSNFGTVDVAQFNIEQLLHAGIYNDIFARRETTFTESEAKLMNELATESFRAYSELKNDPDFLDYLENVSPLRFYSQTNIGSRPAKRGGTEGKLTLETLRAIPFVGAWSQLKQNVPGFYGVGAALDKMESLGKLGAVEDLYRENPFFKALIDNCEMAMQKTFFPLTKHVKDHPVYGRIRKLIEDEYDLTEKLLKKITGRDSLMSDYPVEKQSVETRERIVIPLTTIQQYSLIKLGAASPEMTEALGKLIARCSFGIINAGRNSA
ncbi:MAG: phosphoenolpyruvate carboxylase [Pyrinomonadaceae bacterium]|nr:phosphoenolpyruvate carboxylase [Pyrinomonadaceae bacterium]